MPVTLDGLKLGLKAGAVEFETSEIGTMVSPATESQTYNVLGIVAFGEYIDVNQAYSGPVQLGSVFTEPAESSGKAKSYLGSPAVLNIIKSGTVKRIAFILFPAGTSTSGDFEVRDPGDGSGDTFYIRNAENTTSGHISDTLNKATYNEAGAHKRRADIFMEIDLGSGITVTEGGYLTVKGYSAGVTGSDNFTYVTLESTA